METEKENMIIEKENMHTCVSSSVKWACFLLLERLADSLLESILKDKLLGFKLNKAEFVPVPELNKMNAF